MSAFAPAAALTPWLVLAFAAGCGDSGSGVSRDTGTVEPDVESEVRDTVADTFVPPDTVPTEVSDVPAEVEIEVIVPGEFGAPCTTNAECDSGYCVDGPKGYVCTRTCDTTCPTGYDCRAVSSEDETIFLCMPRLRESCTPCAANFQCAGGLCMDLDGQGRCIYPCEAETDCGEGFECTTSDQGPGTFCVPSTGSCTCYAGADGGLRSCETTGELGVCVGVQECEPETGWSACSATTPAPETCNGRDDDCDGVWDDNLEGVGAECEITVEGVGACKGVQFCLGEAGWLCVAATPAVDVCNLQDDDCDGTADEDFKNAAGLYVNDENCGGCGVTCVDKIPDATAYCNGDGASPRCEVKECRTGYYKAGPLTCLPIVDSTCVPCINDSHCTTPGDRCLQLDGGGYCGRDCAAGNARGTPAGECPTGFACTNLTASGGEGVRQCVPESGSCTCLGGDDGEQRPCTTTGDAGTCFGTQTCDPARGWSTCDAPVAKAETCNSVDDNCNAVIDDVPTRFEACTNTNGFGSCPGTLDCRAGSPALACVGTTPATETCNGRDDDCNGQTDNVVAPLCPKQLGVCKDSRQICAGQLGLLACNIGSYGTNYEVEESKCDGLDNDCDGVTDEVDFDRDGHKPIACGGDDCNDQNRLTYKGAPELCGDGQDNDCDGTADNKDIDGDGRIATECNGTDCNDQNDGVYPGQVERCGDALDNDCDGGVDNKDLDRDGFIDEDCSSGSDCDDDDRNVKPGADEECDDVDNNCNGSTDEVDEDRDGFIAEACGGDDCDDSRTNVNPDGVEVCGDVRNLDEDCSGIMDDRDLDDDDHYDAVCEDGDDCDDLDPQTFPNADEVWDTRDNDCNGAYDENLIPEGSVIVTEFMANPAEVDDDLGEWFELTNISRFPINLRGWLIEGGGTVVAENRFTIGVELIIDPGEALTFCRSAILAENGGITCDYEMGGRMNLAQSAVPDYLRGSFDNDDIFETINMHLNATSGASRMLLPHMYTLDGSADSDDANWCNTHSSILVASGHTDRGTPKLINPGECGTATPKPGVALVVPFDGLESGNERVTVFGSGFTGAATVSIGGVNCGSVVFISANMITCQTGSHAPGKVDVTVTVGAKTSTAKSNAYTYTDNNGPSVTLTGTSYTRPAGEWGALIEATSSADQVELGYGNGDPDDDPNWRWYPAGDTGVNTWARALRIDDDGTFKVAYRASNDGISWGYSSTITATITE